VNGIEIRAGRHLRLGESATTGRGFDAGDDEREERREQHDLPAARHDDLHESEDGE
jgi:hypothetical protein